MGAHDTTKTIDELRKLAPPARKIVVSSRVSIIGALMQLALSIFIAFFFFHDGEALVSRLRSAAGRTAGERGHHLADVAAVTVRASCSAFSGRRWCKGYSRQSASRSPALLRGP